MDSMRTYVVGDIHGCESKLRGLFTAIMDHNAGRSCRFIFLGDYIDRGESSSGVISWLMTLQKRLPDQVLFLRGNHEEMFLGGLADNLSHEYWCENGGEATLASYGTDHAVRIPVEHREWIADLPLLYRDERRLFVHAGIKPGVPIAQQSRRDLLWIREPFLSSEEDHGLLVVHGHTPVEADEPDLRPNRLNLDTGACFGGPLTAAIFCDDLAEPLAFITDEGKLSVLREQPVAPDV
jgi:serine/threonine protein phosphatase 1